MGRDYDVFQFPVGRDVASHEESDEFCSWRFGDENQSARGFRREETFVLILGPVGGGGRLTLEVDDGRDLRRSGGPNRNR